MRTHLRVLTALVMVRLAVIALMTLAPQASGLRTVHAADQGHIGALDSQLRDTQSFVHTGLWVAEIGADGTSTFVRDIRRR